MGRSLTRSVMYCFFFFVCFVFVPLGVLAQTSGQKICSIECLQLPTNSGMRDLAPDKEAYAKCWEACEAKNQEIGCKANGRKYYPNLNATNKCPCDPGLVLDGALKCVRISTNNNNTPRPYTEEWCKAEGRTYYPDLRADNKCPCAKGLVFNKIGECVHPGTIVPEIFSEEWCKQQRRTFYPNLRADNQCPCSKGTVLTETGQCDLPANIKPKPFTEEWCKQEGLTYYPNLRADNKCPCSRGLVLNALGQCDRKENIPPTEEEQCQKEGRKIYSNAPGGRLCPCASGLELNRYGYCEPVKDGVIASTTGDEVRCPTGATIVREESTKTCQCPAGTEPDDLQTICLKKDQIKKNLNSLLSVMPDDILVALVKKHSTPEIQDKLATLSLAGTLGSLFSSQSAEGVEANIIRKFMADALYTGLIKNTKNLQQAIKHLGKETTEALLHALAGLSKNNGEEKSTQTAPGVTSDGSGSATRSPYSQYMKPMSAERAEQLKNSFSPDNR